MQFSMEQEKKTALLISVSLHEKISLDFRLFPLVTISGLADSGHPIPFRASFRNLRIAIFCLPVASPMGLPWRDSPSPRNIRGPWSERLAGKGGLERAKSDSSLASCLEWILWGSFLDPECRSGIGDGIRPKGPAGFQSGSKRQLNPPTISSRGRCPREPRSRFDSIAVESPESVRSPRISNEAPREVFPESSRMVGTELGRGTASCDLPRGGRMRVSAPVRRVC